MAAARPIWPKAGSAFVRDQLTGHKMLGLAIGALMYIICVSGTAAVFYQDFERWERPTVPEAASAAPQAVARAVAHARAVMIADKARTPEAEDLFVVLPSADLPRLTAGYGETALAYAPDGAPRGDGAHDITHFLVELHYALHLPGPVGLLVVGILGVGLMALILGGLLAHPRILKDAFLLRPMGSRRVALTDVHNRLGVWAAPFHAVIALTGAMIGLAQVVAFAIALAFNGGDAQKAFEPLFGSEAETLAITGGRTLQEGAVVTALNEMAAKAPDARPMWVVLHKVGQKDEHLEITAVMAQRTGYGEVFRFDSAGRFVSKAGLSDGPIGKQVYASLYPLHFGSFGGIWVKLAYAVLGLGLCVICATGFDIWLVKAAEKGRPHPRLHKVWTVFAWTMPAALCLAAAANLLFKANPELVFWGGLAAFVLGAAALSGALAAPQGAWSRASKLFFGLSLIALPAAHIAVFKSFNFAAAAPNAAFAALGALVLLHAAGWPAVSPAPKPARASGEA